MTTEPGLLDGGPPSRTEAWLHLRRPNQTRVLSTALLATSIAWVPLVLLAAAHGPAVWADGERPFLEDIAVYARFLVALPLLIIAESICLPRLGQIARQFVDAGLVDTADRARFDAAAVSTRRLLNSVWAEIGVLSLTYALVAANIAANELNQLPAWHRAGPGGWGAYSAAGWWHALVSIPLLLVLELGWLWRLALWARFLWLVSRLNLRLLPSHPDKVAGLSFVGYFVRPCGVLAFSISAVIAGTIANRVVHTGESPLAYKYLVAGLVVFVVVLFVAPLSVFAGNLLRAWKRGVHQYGALADEVGREFEANWLNRSGKLPENPLETQAFSATTDLYAVVANVYAMRFVPIDLQSLIGLIAATLAPLVPVVLLVTPLDVMLKSLAGALL